MKQEEAIEVARVQPIILHLGDEITETPDWNSVEKVVSERYDVNLDQFDVTELKPWGARVRRKRDGKIVLLAAQREPGGVISLYEYIYE